MEVGRSRRAVREAAAVPGCGGTARRREALRPRRVCAGDLKEAEHDCAFGGVARRTALPEVSLSQPRVELLPGEVGLLVSGGEELTGAVPGERSSCLWGRGAWPESEEVGRRRPLLGRSLATPWVVPSVKRQKS